MKKENEIRKVLTGAMDEVHTTIFYMSRMKVTRNYSFEGGTYEDLQKIAADRYKIDLGILKDYMCGWISIKEAVARQMELGFDEE